MEPVLWSVLGLTIVVTAPMARQHERARVVGVLAIGALFLLAGALVNLLYLLGDTDYAGFADASHIPFVRETWRSVVAPRQELFIGLLVAGEAVIGLAVLAGAPWRRWGLIAAISFHVALLSFGWFFFAWAVPMILALSLHLRASRVDGTTSAPDEQVEGGDAGPPVTSRTALRT